MASPFTLTGSRIQNATRANQAAEDADVVDWVVGDDFIICMMIEAGGAGASGTLEIHWRNVTDSGSFTKLVGTGELNWNGTTDLVNENAVTAGEEACTPISGTTHGDGVEREGANDVSPTLPANYYAEGQYAVDGSGMLAGKQYEFQVYDATDGSAVGTCLSQITTAAATAYTLTADSASYSLTGQDATLRAGYKLAATTNSYSFTGSNASLRANRKLTADSGAYNYTGQDATLTYTPATGDYVLTCDPASYSFTGQDVDLIAPTQGGGVKRKVRYVKDLKMPWEQEEDDWIEEEIQEALKPKLKLHKPDYIDVHQEIANIEAAIEYDKRNKVIKKRNQRKKAFEMLLANL